MMNIFIQNTTNQEVCALIAQTIAFVAIWLLVHRHVARHGPMSHARTFTFINSWVYSAASFGLLYLILSPGHEDMARRLYHGSKFYEYVDVIGVRAGGGVIDLHFGFHHLTTPYLSFLRVVRYSDGWHVLGSLNALHHGLMYAYFGGAGFLRQALAVTGTGQLVVGICGEALLVWQKLGADGPAVWPHVASLSLLGAYLVLWIRDLRMRRG